MNRRKIRRYRNRRGNSGVKFLGIVGIMIVAVICGYMTARFIIAPLLGYDTEVLKLDFPSRLASVFSGSEERGGAQDGVSEDGGYALQFGLFSTEDRAEELADRLNAEGIETQIQKTGTQYRVLSPLVSTKKEALETLKNTESKHVDDIFVTRL